MRKMNRGKQQILYHYLPSRTFDFEKSGTIAIVDKIRGRENNDLIPELIYDAIEEQISTWNVERRQIFGNMKRSANRFVLIEPLSVESKMFPMVFWCQNSRCGIVRQLSSIPSTNICGICGTGKLVQMRFIKIHRCGDIKPLIAPTCQHCQRRDRMALDTRESEKISNFRWICRNCSNVMPIFAGPCRACNWPDTQKRNMSIEIHRAGRTYYPHNIVLLNQPTLEIKTLLSINNWENIVAGKYINLGILEGRSLDYFTRIVSAKVNEQDSNKDITESERKVLVEKGLSEEKIQQFIEMNAILNASKQKRENVTLDKISKDLVAESGVPLEVWKRAGHEILETIVPIENATQIDYENIGLNKTEVDEISNKLTQLGFLNIKLATDFPITLATFGYSRSDFQPNECNINPFNADPDFNGRFPIFVDTIQADAIIIRLNPANIIQWLRENGQNPIIPTGKDSEKSLKAFFVTLFDSLDLKHTLNEDNPMARMVFNLLHTISHLAIKRAALLCGLEVSSLAEYLMPKSLSIAIYCNHRFGSTIGALSALYEQSLINWLSEIYSNRRCVYDPVCIERQGYCHACCHLPETSCRFYNINLGRQFLFGGPDEKLGNIQTGYFDMIK